MSISSISLVDTHCHIHDDDYPLSPVETLENSASSGVNRVITMGSDVDSSLAAVDFSSNYSGQYGVDIYYGLGIHPHNIKPDSNLMVEKLRKIASQRPNNLVAIGEVGLDYYYNEQSANQQIEGLQAQIQLAVDLNLPLSFHVRSGQYGDAFSDFWVVLNNFHSVRGVIHSFTDSEKNLEIALKNNLLIGVNGIVTFNKQPELDQVYNLIPLTSLVLETDAPYLSPIPFRGKPNQPASIARIADFMANKRGVSLSELASITTANAGRIFSINHN